MLKRLSVNFLGGSSEPAPEEIRQSVMVDYGDVFDAEKETDYIGREKRMLLLFRIIDDNPAGLLKHHSLLKLLSLMVMEINHKMK